MKKDNSANIKVKYVIYKLYSYFGNKENFDDEGSIEHIFPKITANHALNTGTLILLKEKINDTVEEYL